MNIREKERQDRLEYITDDNGKRHFIYPMKLKDINRVTALFDKINDTYPILNLPMGAVDANGEPILDEDGNQVIDDEPYMAMKELCEMALHDTWENIEQWLDIGMVSDLLYSFRDMSSLKKKMDKQMESITDNQAIMKVLGIASMPV